MIFDGDNFGNPVGRTDPNVPWDLTYRYTGYISTTRSGRACLAWHDLDWHWRRPLSDLERAGCRSLPDYAEGRPGCFYVGGLGVPEDDWRFEECDIPVCEVDCARYRNMKEFRSAIKKERQEGRSVGHLCRGSEYPN